MLNSLQLMKFMNQFYGYGNLLSENWFIGMEEGGGNTKREIEQRLSRWQALGSQKVVDNVLFHEAVQDKDGKFLSYYFDNHAKIQRTWAGLIRILLAINGQKDNSASEVRRFQSSSWGRINSDNCILELLPLPSPGINVWHYNKWSDLKELRSRETYKTYVIVKRIQQFQGLLKKYTPRLVVFYSVSSEYLLHWSEIAGKDFSEVDKNEVCIGNQGQSFSARFYSNGNTIFVVVYHPTYTGITNEYFTKVGKKIRKITF